MKFNPSKISSFSKQNHNYYILYYEQSLNTIYKHHIFENLFNFATGLNVDLKFSLIKSFLFYYKLSFFIKKIDYMSLPIKFHTNTFNKRVKRKSVF